MASYNASFKELYRDTEFGEYNIRFYKITSTSTIPAIGEDFTVTFPSLTSSQYVSSTGDFAELGFGSNGTIGQYRLSNVPEGMEGAGGDQWCPSIYGGTYTFRRVGYYDDLLQWTEYIYNLSTNYSTPPKITSVSIDSSTVGTINFYCSLNWGKAVKGTVDCTLSYTLDGIKYEYSCYNKKFTQGYNLTMTPSSSSQWVNYTPSSSALSKNYQVTMKIVDLFGKDYYKGTTKYWEIFPDGADVTAVWKITTDDGSAILGSTQYCPMLWEVNVIDTSHQGGTTTPPDSVKGGGIKQPTGAVNDWRRFRLIEK